MNVLFLPWLLCYWKYKYSFIAEVLNMRPAAAYFLARDVQAERLCVDMIATSAIDNHT